ncbi:MAG: PBP1A family penicillin-binding protein, partial [Caldisericia bacterium]|nr:PBP1A family penicillin-binding protein [Caldisericia bacterium]
MFYPRKIVSKNREKRKNSKKSFNKKRAILIFLIIIVFLFSSIFIYAFSYYKYIITFLPKIEEIQFDPPESSEIYDRKGNLIKTVYFIENRINISLSELPEYFINALIASEDERFYSHKGVDFKSLIRATIINFREKRIVEGGSTITMQLARELFLTKEVTLERKFKEMILALRLENIYSKEEILTYYVNQIFFGSGAYGVEAAARRYFGKHAKDLTLAESAMLVGILPSPSVYPPTINFDLAKERQKIVLERMVKNGFITEEEKEKALNEEIILKEYKEDVSNDPNGWFIDYVKDRVREILGEEILYKGGLKIYTTIDPDIQNLAFTSFNKVIDDNVKAKIFSNKKDELGVKQPQGAVVVLDPKTGEILSMVGGRDYSETQFNRTLALRKPGSSFKIFDYTPAIENGVVTPATILVSEEMEIAGWKPTEWEEEGKFFGTLNVRQALTKSSNICAVKTGLRVGLDRVVYYAKKMGIRTPLEPYPSMTIGGFEVTPLDMAVAYGVLSNMGERVDATGVLKIIGKDGRVVYENKTNPVRVVSPEASYVMTDIFKDVLYYYFPQFKNLPIACKSGTSGDFTSAWFIGYTNDYVVSCYVGSDKELIGLEGVYNWGSRFAGQIWKNVMQELIKIKKPVDWEKPEKVVYAKVCSDSGLLPTPFCTNTKTEIFISGYEPKYECPIHRSEYIDVAVCIDS